MVDLLKFHSSCWSVILIYSWDFKFNYFYALPRQSGCTMHLLSFSSVVQSVMIDFSDLNQCNQHVYISFQNVYNVESCNVTVVVFVLFYLFKMKRNMSRPRESKSDEAFPTPASRKQMSSSRIPSPTRTPASYNRRGSQASTPQRLLIFSLFKDLVIFVTKNLHGYFPVIEI